MKRSETALCIVQALVFVAALVLAVTPTFAAHDDGVLEIDGDVVPFNGPTGTQGEDWQTLFTCTAEGIPGCDSTGLGSASDRSHATDPAPGSIFTGGGSKDELDIPNWRWKNGSVPDKDDLTSAFAAAYTDASGNQRIYFGADRLANNGDAQIGFWFFQKVVQLGSDGTFIDASGNPATHTVGDVLILSNFTNGGTTANIQVLTVTAVNFGGSVTLRTLVAGAAGANLVCTTGAFGFPADAACAATNAGAATALDPDYVPKFGTPGQYPAESFFEGGLNLSAVGLGGECFPTFLVETRSSQSIDAVLKDFTLKAFQQCAASVRTEIHAGDDHATDVQGTTIPANTSIHDKAIVTGTIGFPTPTGTVTFEFFTNATCSGTPNSVEGPVALVEQTPPTATTAGDAAAESVPFVPLPGSYSFRASYSGDFNYPGDTSPCEPVTVSRLNSAVNTRILRVADGAEVTDQAINLMDMPSVDVQDEATVVGFAGGPVPTGTVTIRRFNNGDCSGSFTEETVLLDGTGQALSSVFSLGPNTLSYTATYNGDSNYTPSAVSKCEPVCALNFTSTQSQPQ